MVRGLISLLMNFLPQSVAIALLCAVCIGFFGVFIPRMEKKKQQEEQEWYRALEQQHQEKCQQEKQEEA